MEVLDIASAHLWVCAKPVRTRPAWRVGQEASEPLHPGSENPLRGSETSPRQEGGQPPSDTFPRSGFRPEKRPEGRPLAPLVNPQGDPYRQSLVALDQPRKGLAPSDYPHRVSTRQSPGDWLRLARLQTSGAGALHTLAC